MAGGGIYEFHDREVPDTFYMMGDYAKGHSIVLSASMANSQHIPGLIRGHGASLTMVEHGMFERYSPFITLKADRMRDGKYIVPELADKFKGETEIKIPIENNNMMTAHIGNFLSCMRSREKPVLDVETAAHAQVLISMGVQSYREGKVLYFDEKKWKVSDKPVKA